MPNTLLSMSAALPPMHVMHAMNAEANISLLLTSSSPADAMVSELDPDAPGRSGRALHPSNARSQERILARVWQFMRAGEGGWKAYDIQKGCVRVLALLKNVCLNQILAVP